MSWTLDTTTDAYRRPGTAKRTITRAPQVPSQDVCRHQAIDPPRFKPRPSVIARLHLWWERTSAEPDFWRGLIVLIAVSIIAAALIVTR